MPGPDAPPCFCCQDTPDPLSGDRLYALGVAEGTEGRSLASTIHAVQVQWGTLALAQLQDLIRGWHVGSEDAPSFEADMTSLADADSDPGPF